MYTVHTLYLFKYTQFNTIIEYEVISESKQIIIQYQSLNESYDLITIPLRNNYYYLMKILLMYHVY